MAPPSTNFIINAISKAGLTDDNLEAVRRWLQGQLAAHEYAKLGQGGHTNTEVPLRRVFIDLPVAESSGEIDVDDRVPFLASILAAKPVRLKDAFRNERLIDVLKSNIPDVPRPHISARRTKSNAFSANILIGGPGQGKSTLGQLACQIHRAELLRPFLKQLNSADKELVQSFCLEIDTPKSIDSLKKPTVVMLPLQVSLPDLAVWLAEDSPNTKAHPPSIIRFLTDLDSAKQCRMSSHVLTALAIRLPIILVLDGFDEVGASQDRERLVAAANELLVFLAQHDGQAQIIATTRPQGYSDEFAKIGIDLTTSYLLPLEKHEALVYAQKLVAQKIQGLDEQRQTLDRLQEAANEPATERLLTTPLQVTILTALVQHRGRAPRERWNLFHNYFNFTYAREIERNSYASELLRNYKHHIEQIHARVGLLLQVEAERDGGASARISRMRLEEIICSVLADAGFDDNEQRQVLVDDIVSAAKLRLVFLVEPEPGSFGFEIRSFQEFMCAWALTNGREIYIENRIATIARAPMFRNVTLFCASRLFSEGLPICDVFARLICVSLDENTNDPAASITKAGAILALETLEEGAVLSYPKYARQLVLRAIESLKLAPSRTNLRLARVVTSDTKNTIFGAIEENYISENEKIKFNNRSVWVLLLELINLGTEGAIQLADEIWKESHDIRRMVQDCRQFGVALNEWLKNKILENKDICQPEYFIGIRYHRRQIENNLDWLEAITEIFDSSYKWGNRIPGMDAFRLNDSAHNNKFLYLTQEKIYPEWNIWATATLFEISPSSETLANALIALSTDINKIQEFRWRASWPLAACLNSIQNSRDLIVLADRIRVGEFGSTKTWRALEEKWKLNLKNSTIFEVSEILPWDVESAYPPPHLLTWWSFQRGDPAYAVSLIKEVVKKFHEKNDPAIRKWYAQVGLSTISRHSPNIAEVDHLINDELILQWLKIDPSFIASIIPRPIFLSEVAWITIFKTMIIPEDLSYLGNFDYFFSEPPDFVPTAVLDIYIQSFVLHFAREQETIESLKRILSRQPIGYLKSLNGLILLTLCGDLSINSEQLLIDILLQEEYSSIYFDAFIISLQESRFSIQRMTRILLPLMSLGEPKLAQIISVLNKAFQMHTSGLDIHSTWDQLALTLPRPQHRALPVAFENMSLEPIGIKSLELKDIAGFKNINFDFSESESGKGQWIVILGKNGVGKTSILRSIALALRNTDDPTIWPANSLSLPWLRIGATDSEEIVEASINISLANGGKYRTRIRSDGLPIFIREVNDTPFVYPVFGYGCRRGSALGGKTGKVNLSSKDGLEIASLFDPESDLLHAESWLIHLEGDSQKNSRSKIVYEHVTEALRELLEVEIILVKDMAVFVKIRDKPLLRLALMSDGYLTSAGWFVDLIARWVFFVEKAGREITSGFMSQMTGLVLIDELDLHLHPKWQIEIISKTRELLPRMSFVVTTHNPLTLVGASANEIWTLEDENESISANIGIDNPMLMTGAEIYNEYFGIRSVYPKEIGEKVHRYSFLSRFALRDDQEETELQGLRNQLSELNLLPNWPIAERKVRHNRD